VSFDSSFLAIYVSSNLQFIQSFLNLFSNDLSSPDSIIGVTLFSEVAPQDFGAFDRAFVSMFRLTAGETWLESLERYDEKGQLNYTNAVFVLSYIILVVWVLLQVPPEPAPMHPRSVLDTHCTW
jgi:hypothetical protein